jgi:membrane protein
MRRLIDVFRGAAIRFSQDGCGPLAQAIAFNALFAIFPIVLLTVGVLAYVYGSKAAEVRGLALVATLAPGIQEIVADNLRQLVQTRGFPGIISGIIGLLVLAWSAKNLFMALAYALNRALGIPQGRPFLSDLFLALVMLPVTGVLLLAATAVPLLVSIAVRFGNLRESIVISQVVSYATGLVVIFLLAAILYTYLPNERMPWWFGIPGAIFTAVAWEIAQIAFAVYSTHVDLMLVYGAVATFAILLLWLYYMGIIFLFGALLSAQWARWTPAASKSPPSSERRSA